MIEVTLRLRKLYNSFVPVDQVTVDRMKEIPANAEFDVLISDNQPKHSRSAAQNRLYWAWLTDCSRTGINEWAGWSKDEWHYEFKRRYLCVIFERDDANYAETVQALRVIYKCGLKDAAELLFNKWVDKQTSTAAANIAQFTEYLNCLESFCLNHGIYLRTDPALYAAAMGIKPSTS